MLRKKNDSLPSDMSLSRISQANIVGFSRLYCSILETTAGVATFGLEPPIKPGGRKVPVNINEKYSYCQCNYKVTSTIVVAPISTLIKSNICLLEYSSKKINYISLYKFPSVIQFNHHHRFGIQKILISWFQLNQTR